MTYKIKHNTAWEFRIIDKGTPVKLLSITNSHSCKKLNPPLSKSLNEWCYLINIDNIGDFCINKEDLDINT